MNELAKHRRIKKSSIALLSMMIPGIIYILVNNYIPMAGLVIAFKKYNFSKGFLESEWVGLSNFTYLFKTKDALYIVRNTLVYNFVFILLGNVFSVAVAVLLNFLRGKLSKKVYQTLILVPYLISMVIVSYIVYGFLSVENGVINRMLAGAGNETINFYAIEKYWFLIFIVVYLWKNYGYLSILYYATVIGIDSALYEAAAIDGAKRWHQVWYVTLPGLKNTIITMVLLSIGRMFFSDFGLFYQVPMHSGLITNVTDTIDVYVYKVLSQLNDVGRSSAAGFLQSVLGFVLIMVVNFVVRKIDEESALF